MRDPLYVHESVETSDPGAAKLVGDVYEDGYDVYVILDVHLGGTHDCVYRILSLAYGKMDDQHWTMLDEDEKVL